MFYLLTFLYIHFYSGLYVIESATYGDFGDYLCTTTDGNMMTSESVTIKMT